MGPDERYRIEQHLKAKATGQLGPPVARKMGDNTVIETRFTWGILHRHSIDGIVKRSIRFKDGSSFELPDAESWSTPLSARPFLPQNWFAFNAEP